MENLEVANLLFMIDQAFDHKAWHGTNLRGSIKRVNAAGAAWRPGGDRHNIWEIVVHAAYWKYIARRRLLSEARGSFPLKGSNWFARPAGDAPDESKWEAQWKADVALLVETHRSLREAIAAMSPKELRYTPPASKFSNLALITGIASHDLYHAGQIQLLKRLGPAASSSL